MSTRAVRFSTEENERINLFLKENPVMDFSTLARLAINQFIESPEIKLTSINEIQKPKIKSPEVNHGHN